MVISSNEKDRNSSVGRVKPSKNEGSYGLVNFKDLYQKCQYFYSLESESHIKAIIMVNTFLITSNLHRGNMETVTCLENTKTKWIMVKQETAYIFSQPRFRKAKNKKSSPLRIINTKNKIKKKKSEILSLCDF